MPKNWALPKDKQIIIGLENSSSKSVHRCRFMVFIHGLRDIPLHFRPDSFEEMENYVRNEYYL